MGAIKVGLLKAQFITGPIREPHAHGIYSRHRGISASGGL